MSKSRNVHRVKSGTHIRPYNILTHKTEIRSESVKITFYYQSRKLVNMYAYSVAPAVTRMQMCFVQPIN